MEEVVLVCGYCYIDGSHIVYNINGRCDCCGYSSWVELSELERQDT